MAKGEFEPVVHPLVVDISEVLMVHGVSVYTVQVWATLDGEPGIISAVSVFHEVEVPEGYGGTQQ